MTLGQTCNHGQLKRQCNVCDLEERIAELESHLAGVVAENNKQCAIIERQTLEIDELKESLNHPSYEEENRLRAELAALQERYDNGPMGEEINDILRSKLAAKDAEIAELKSVIGQCQAVLVCRYPDAETRLAIEAARRVGGHAEPMGRPPQKIEHYPNLYKSGYGDGYGEDDK